MTTLANFRTRVSAKIGLDNTASSADQSLVDSWLNEGVVDVLRETGCNVDSTTVTPGATADYALGVSVLGILDVYTTSGSSDSRMQQLSVPDMLELRRNGSSAAGPTTYYAMAGTDLMLFYPTPGASDTFTMYVVPKPTAMSVSSDDPSSASLGGVRTEFHKAIELYALAEAADYDDDGSSAQGQRYRERYREELGRIRRSLNLLGRYKQPAAVLPTQRRRMGARRFNDQDWR
ncbi:MAG: hypothetical protein NUW01_16205 [Gemmatimonadaceae bacterium]|nr:hypothetical protein [Gemmatimonadaceae bacterium]